MQTIDLDYKPIECPECHWTDLFDVSHIRTSKGYFKLRCDNCDLRISYPEVKA
jgi:hypothetical protein